MSLFTDDEVKALRSSWKLIVKGGRADAGLLILRQLFNDAPASRGMFSHIGVEQEGICTLEKLKSNSNIVNHAHRLVSRLNNIIESLEDSGKVIEICTEIGRSHAKHGTLEVHFEILGPVLVSVLCSALQMEVSHPTIQTWIKAYGAISQVAKGALTKENAERKSSY